MHNVLTHPAYAGAYVFGKTRQRRYVGEDGQLRTRRRKLPQGEWEVLITDHHRGFIDWDTYQANQARIGANTRPRAHEPGTGAVREGCALLQGLATCGTCGRKLAVYYDGPSKSTPGYYCTGTGQLVDGRGTRHLRVGGVAIDAAVADAFLAALAARRAAGLPGRRPATRRRPRRRARAVAPPGRAGPLPGQPGPSAATGPSTPTTGWSPAAWRPSGNHALQQLADAEAELARREHARPKTLTPQEKQAILALGDDLGGVWSAATTTDKDRKQLLRTLLDEVNISVHRDHEEGRADLVLRWKGGAITELTVPLKRKPPASAHRRGHHRPAAPPGRPLPRRHHRRDPQPARPPHRPRIVVHRQ